MSNENGQEMISEEDRKIMLSSMPDGDLLEESYVRDFGNIFDYRFSDAEIHAEAKRRKLR